VGVVVPDGVRGPGSVVVVSDAVRGPGGVVVVSDAVRGPGSTHPLHAETMPRHFGGLQPTWMSLLLNTRHKLIHVRPTTPRVGKP
jgi:hypothetical protein